MSENETIVAISTPPGRGGIGIVRLSGAQAKSIAEPMLRLRHPLGHAQARLGEILDPETAARMDEAIITYFAAPHSYTGEDMVEIAAHGSPVILNALVNGAMAAGARLAEPGEFTQRAFLSGRIDLTQAEAVRDLIEAQTLYQARVAAQQMEGSLSRRVRPVKQQLVDLIAVLEAGIDFAEDDVDVMRKGEILDRLAALQAFLQSLADSFLRGRIVHSGLTLAIVGRANAGKSSIFNRIAERERAIVTAVPGTTRDLVTERVSLGGIPVELVDTAGLRAARDGETLEEAEEIGIRKSREALADADVVLLVLDATLAPGEEERELLKVLAERRAIAVVNKIDLAGTESPMQAALPSLGLVVESSSLNTGRQQEGIPVVCVSALTGEGIDRLKAAILAVAGGSSWVQGGIQAEAEGGILTNLRQSQAVAGALAAVEAGRRAVEQEIPHEMVLLDLYQALRHLDSLTGETTPDDILNLIFTTFCIGK